MNSEHSVMVHFRRYKSSDEHRADTESGIIKPDKFVLMGKMIMSQVPDEGRHLFVNGQSYIIKNVTWSVHLPEDDNYSAPEAMLTLEPGMDWRNSWVPKGDFVS